MNEIKIALLGLGTVGCGVAKILQSHGAELAERAGCRLAFGRVVDADLTGRATGSTSRACPSPRTQARPSTIPRCRS